MLSGGLSSLQNQCQNIGLINYFGIFTQTLPWRVFDLTQIYDHSHKCAESSQFIVAASEKAIADLETARRTADLTARQLLRKVTSGLAQVRALEAAERSSQLALDSNLLGYQVGVRINIDVLNAQQQLFSTRRDLALARYTVLVDGLRLRQAVGGLSDTDLVAVNTLLVPFSPTADGAASGTPGDGLSILSGSSATSATTGPISTPSVTAGSVQANEPVKPSTGLPVKPARRAKGKPTP